MSNKTPKLTDKQRRFIEEYCADPRLSAASSGSPGPARRRAGGAA